MFTNPTQVTSRMMLHSSFKKAYFEISAAPAVSATKNESKDLSVKVFDLLQRFTSKQTIP